MDQIETPPLHRNILSSTAPTLLKIKSFLTLWKSKKDLQLLLWAVIYFIVCLFFASLSNSNADRYFNSPEYPKIVLHDVFVESVSPWFQSSNIPQNTSDVFVNCATILIFLRLLFLGKEATTVFRRMLYISASIFLVRSWCVSLTILPTPWTDCKSSPNSNYIVDAILIMARIRYSCGDTFFSGHTIFFTCCLLLWLYYPLTIKKGFSWSITTLIVIFNLSGMISLVMSRFHYTIDVLIAFILVLNLWFIIWQHTDNKMVKKNTTLGKFLAKLDDPLYNKNTETDVIEMDEKDIEVGILTSPKL